MLKKLFLLFLTFPITLSACGTLNVTVERTPLPVTLGVDSTSTSAPTIAIDPTPTAPDQLLTMDSSSDLIRQVMLHSALNWKTIWMDGVIYESMDSTGIRKTASASRSGSTSPMPAFAS